jgi:soluble lytic murein transglycosylase-like protein
MDVDQAWRHGSTVWYRRGNVGQSVEREVRAIEPIRRSAQKEDTQGRNSAEKEKITRNPQVTWIYLVGGARFKVDDVRQVADGAWYSRGNVSIFLASDRIARIERIEEGLGAHRGRDLEWTSGNSRIDQLIRTNGARFGIDPYLIFCVIEHESHFHPRALSPKGAQGLMQLMPSTARRFGVSRPYDIAENIRGGTQYLKELMTMFSGHVSLVLASYNAGEGAVLKYGRTVPPYKETREYVKRIGRRYGLNSREANPENEITPPRP